MQCGSYTFDAPTLAYMPHCPKELYDALLRANWSKDGLRRLVLCGNDLERYSMSADTPALARIRRSLD